MALASVPAYLLTGFCSDPAIQANLSLWTTNLYLTTEYPEYPIYRRNVLVPQIIRQILFLEPIFDANFHIFLTKKDSTYHYHHLICPYNTVSLHMLRNVNNLKGPQHTDKK